VSEATGRWRAIEPLLPAPAAIPVVDCGAELAITGPGGEVLATGTCEHWAGDAGSLEMSWGAARRFILSPRVSGPDVGQPLDLLLSRWRDHLATVPGTADPDTAAVINWPSRDVDGVAALLRHGLAPLEVIAARKTPRSLSPNGAPRLTPVPLIRPADQADIEALVRFGMEVIRFDARFGATRERPDTAAALRREVAGLLADGWTWMAERDGVPIGMLAAQRPESAGWIAALTGAAPAEYLMLMFVEPGERASGVGSALVERFHLAVSVSGTAVTLLHHEQLNPFSTPFWNRHGYRPYGQHGKPCRRGRSASTTPASPRRAPRHSPIPRGERVRPALRRYRYGNLVMSFAGRICAFHTKIVCFSAGRKSRRAGLLDGNRPRRHHRVTAD
jgi:GNAT superfamily N-acetyltransferase